MTRRTFLHLFGALMTFANSAVFRTPTASAADAEAPVSITIPAGVVLVHPDVRRFEPAIFVADQASAKIETVQGRDKFFAESLRLTTIKPSPQGWQIGVNAATQDAVHKGDVLWVHFWARRIESHQESGEAVAEVTFMQTNDLGKEVRPLERVFSCGPEWVETALPFAVEFDAPAGRAKLAIRFGEHAQSFEIGGITLLNLGAGVDLAKVPRTVTRYEGHAPDAPWRAAAAARIEKIRKGDLKVRVIDAAGRPVADASISVRMRRHAFTWGTEVDAKRIVADKGPDADRYRQTIETYFNKVVFGNDLKWGAYVARGEAGRQNIRDALDWLDARHIPVRGHVMVWPSWQNLPKFMKDLKNDPNALREAVFAHIDDQTAQFGKRLTEWDVVNESFANNDLLKILGRDAMVDWFQRAHRGAPNVRLFYNDYIMFHGTTPEAPSQYLYDTVQYLLDHGAPIGGIGEQAHFGGNPPGPAQVIAQLDRFSKFGLPIQINEFDIESPDEDLSTDFTRDFTTAIFSHPAVSGMIQWGFWEPAHWKGPAALWRKDWTIRPHGQAWVDLVTKTWWTNADGRTAADGTYNVRGFFGDYDVTVEDHKRTKHVSLTLTPDLAVQSIDLP